MIKAGQKVITQHQEGMSETEWSEIGSVQGTKIKTGRPREACLEHVRNAEESCCRVSFLLVRRRAGDTASLPNAERSQGLREGD